MIPTIILCLLLIFISTVIGSATVFFFKKSLSSKMSNIILGLASGIMISAGIFGLLLPSIEEGKLQYGNLTIIPVIVGFVLGGLFLTFLDHLIPHFHQERNEEEGPKSTSLSKQLKFFFAVMIHNIPEGLAVGFACGLALQTNEPSALMGALSLAIGMSIQNAPEGAAISIPMLENGVSKPKSFMYGVLSGAVEPIFGLLGILLATSLSFLMPWLLSFSAGAMFYVTIDELLPAARKGEHVHHGLWAFMIGFCIMLILELTI